MNNRLRSLFLFFFLPIFLFGQFSFVQAQTDIQSLIDQLKEQIKALEEELSRLNSELSVLEEVQQEEPSDVFEFQITFSFGHSGEEVRKLQEFLAKDKEVYPEGLVTGYFGPLTQKAVKKFQEKYADDVLEPLGLAEGTGYVGEKTIEKLNELYGAIPAVPATPAVPTEESAIPATPAIPPATTTATTTPEIATTTPEVVATTTPEVVATTTPEVATTTVVTPESTPTATTTDTTTTETATSTEESPQFLLKWGSQGSGNGQFTWPIDIVIDASSNIYVTESGNHRIQKFTSDGTFVTKWGSQGSGDGQFNQPYGVAVDSSNNIYVADTSNHRIQKFTSEGVFVTKWGSQGSGDGQFGSPFGIAIDASDNVYVVDRGNHRIQKFTSEGVFVTKWGSQGSGDGQFLYPFGIAIDANSNIYVTESHNHRVQKFTSDGIFVTKWGSQGSGDGQFNQPYGVAVDSSNNIYVVDYGNHRVQKFTSDGTFVTKWGSQGSGDGQFSWPNTIVTDDSSNVYVADTSNQRIQKFGSGESVIATTTATTTSATDTTTICWRDPALGESSDTVCPVLSSIQVFGITSNSVVVSWATDELSDSEVKYGHSSEGAEAHSASSTAMTTSHQLYFSGLLSNTSYNYRIYSKDVAGNLAYSNRIMNFTTLSAVATTTAPPTTDTSAPAEVTNFTAVAGDGQVTLSWTNPTDLDWAGTKIIRQVGNYPSATWDGLQVYSGQGISVVDTGRTNGTTYYYKAYVYDNASVGVTAMATPVSSTTTTSSCTSLSIDFLNNKTQQIYIQGDTVNYIWSCIPTGTRAPNVTVQVAKPDGTVTTYNSSSNSSTQTLGFGTSNLNTGDHELRFCFDPQCSPVPTAYMIFKIAPPSDVIISNIQASNVATSSATISWNTDQPTVYNMVEWGTGLPPDMYTYNNTSATNHTFNLISLTPGTTYYFRVSSDDDLGKKTRSEDQTFTTSSDVTAPVISSIQASNINDNSATISWTTDELTVYNRVEYGIDASYGQILSGADNATSHSVSLSGLASGTTYHFRVWSDDLISNRTISPDQTFTTTEPIILSIKGRLVNDITKQPVTDTSMYIWNWKAGVRRDYYINSDGTFTINLTQDDVDNASTSYINSVFASGQACYDQTSFSRSRSATGELNVGDVLLWPVTGFDLTSDIPVKFTSSRGTGNSRYKTTHALSTLVPININTNITLTDEIGNQYVSPWVQYDISQHCSRVTLNFSGGQFSWSPAGITSIDMSSEDKVAQMEQILNAMQSQVASMFSAISDLR